MSESQSTQIVSEVRSDSFIDQIGIGLFDDDLVEKLDPNETQESEFKKMEPNQQK